jgi:hypothetical protein
VPDGVSIDPVGVLERPGQALQAISMGDLDAGWRSTSGESAGTRFKAASWRP